MIQKGLQYLFEQCGARTIFEMSGRKFSSHPLSLLPDKFDQPTTTPLEINTLQGFVDYIQHCPDAHVDEIKNTFIHVVSFNRVELITPVFGDKFQRNLWIAANSDKVLVQNFQFGRSMSIPDLIVGLQSYFVIDETLTNILEFVSGIKAEQKQEYSDTGFSQTVSAKRSVTSSIVETKKVPNPIRLRPYRTFLEVEQPESLFVFRLSGAGEGVAPSCSLHEASGGKWKLDAILNIKNWLCEQGIELNIIG